MGAAISKAYAAEGASVGLIDMDETGLKSVVSQIEDTGGGALGQLTDIRDYVQVQDAVRNIEATFGPTDIVVNSAGLGIFKKLVDLTEKEWDRTFDVNVKGMFLVCKAVVPGMIQRGQGLIINIASLAARIRTTRAPGSCYSATKYAVRGFSSNLAEELSHYGIRVCCLSPGGTDTPFWGKPEGRPGLMRPEDVAKAVLFIASTRDEVTVHELAFGKIIFG
jgi:NAD(P)-dependent dehydrogenase (short-subunit alcohol dehydrogenase family)